MDTWKHKHKMGRCACMNTCGMHSPCQCVLLLGPIADDCIHWFYLFPVWKWQPSFFAPAIDAHFLCRLNFQNNEALTFFNVKTGMYIPQSSSLQRGSWWNHGEMSDQRAIAAKTWYVTNNNNNDDDGNDNDDDISRSVLTARKRIWRCLWPLCKEFVLKQVPGERFVTMARKHIGQGKLCETVGNPLSWSYCVLNIGKLSQKTGCFLSATLVAHQHVPACTSWFSPITWTEPR